MRNLLLISLMTTGCGKLFADVTGNVDGNKLSGTSAFWGGPHIVIADAELDCMDMSWVEPYGYADIDEVQTGETFHALHLLYASEEVQDGKLTVAQSNSPVTAWFLVIEEGAVEKWQATNGTLEVEIDKKERVGGTYEVGFGDAGTLKGEFLIETCSNLKKRKHSL